MGVPRVGGPGRVGRLQPKACNTRHPYRSIPWYRCPPPYRLLQYSPGPEGSTRGRVWVRVCSPGGTGECCVAVGCPTGTAHQYPCPPVPVLPPPLPGIPTPVTGEQREGGRGYTGACTYSIREHHPTPGTPPPLRGSPSLFPLSTGPSRGGTARAQGGIQGVYRG